MTTLLKSAHAFKRKALMVTTALTLALSLPFCAYAQDLVDGGDLSSAIDSVGNPGQISITNPTATTAAIDVLASTVIAEWAQFNVPTGTTLNVNNLSAATQATLLSRVISGGASDISGTINAADVNLWLINQNGILFGSTAAINTNSFHASTLDVANQDFFDLGEGTDGFGNGSSVVNFAGPSTATIFSAGGTITTDGTLFFASQSLDLTGTFDAGSGRAAFVAASNVDVQFNPASPLGYTINAGTTVASQTIDGSVTGAGVEFQMVSAAGVVGSLLQVDADLTATTAVLTETGISLQASGLGAGQPSVITNGTLNSSAILDIDVSGTYTTNETLMSASIDIDVGGDVSLAEVTATGNTDITTGGSFTSGIVDTDTLNLSVANGGIDLSGGNTIGTLGAVSAPGNIDINSNSSLAISGLVNATGGNDVRLTSAGDLTIDSTGQVIGDVVAVSATDDFINNRGADAISATDHWVVYSDAPTDNVFGNLDSGNTAIWNGSIANLDPASVTDNRYVFQFQPTLTITTLDATKEYGNDLTAGLAALFTASGFQPGVTNAYLADTASSVYSGAPQISSAGAAVNANVAGSPYAVTAANGNLTLLNGYQLAFSNDGQITITRRAITGTATANDRVYDGTTDATGAVTLSGVIAGDDVSTSGSVFTFADANAGTGVTVNVSATSLTGADASNYTLTIPPTALADIFARAITGAATADDRVYDGTTDATGSVTLSGVIAGDDVSTSGSVFTFADANAGTGITVNVSGTSLTGTDAGNYTLTIPATTLADIMTRAITGTATADDRVYDGTTDATGSVTLSGIISGDNVSTTGSVFTFADANAGTGITVNVSGTSLTGTDAGNYTLTIPATALADIFQRTLAITADNVTRGEGEEDPDFSFTVGGEGLVGEDELSGALSRLSGEAPGIYNVLLGSLTAGSNYVIEFTEGVLTISPAAIVNPQPTNTSSLDNSLRTVLLPSALVNSSSSEVSVSFDKNSLCDDNTLNCEGSN